MKKIIQKTFLIATFFITSVTPGTAKDIVHDAQNSSDFLQPPMPPRIYAQAPSGVMVSKIILPKTNRHISGSTESSDFKTLNSTRFRASTHKGKDFRGLAAPCVPQYYLFHNSWTDYDKFSIDRCSGTISTAKYVDKPIGHLYKIIVFATDHQNESFASTEIRIEVTPYNAKPPILALPHYTTEILDTSSHGSIVLTPVASDNDTDPVNRELYFSLQTPVIPSNPWFHPVMTPLMMNTTSGEIRVSDVLLNYTSPLHFRILVSDGGSPPRVDSARLTLHIRNMSAPRNVKILNITKSSMKVCWSPPLHGTPEGYLVAYNSRGSGGNAKGTNDAGKLNLTIDQLETRTDDTPVNIQMMSEGFQDDNDTKQTSLDVQEELYSFFAHQFCTQVSDLSPLTNYAISVRAWASNGRISMARLPLTAITWRKNCNDVVCEHGVCQEKNASPGFVCLCSTGYFGQYCQKDDPCVQRKGNFTCLNGGTCHSNPYSSDSNELICECPPGYFGDRCQNIDPCHVSETPCLNGGTCVPITEEDFTCKCTSFKAGERCEIDAAQPGPQSYCKADDTHSAEGTLNWPAALIGTTTYLPCPFGIRELQVELSSFESNNDVYTVSNHSNSDVLRRSTRSYPSDLPEAEIELHKYLIRRRRSTNVILEASRTCIQNEEGISTWLDPRVSACKTNEEVTEDIANLTASISSLNASTLASSVRKISNLVKGAINNKEMAQSMITAFSDLLNAKETVFGETKESTNSSESILSTIDEYTSKVSLKLGEIIKIRTENVIVEAKLIHKDDLPEEVSFNPYSQKDDIDDSNAQDEKENKFWFKMPRASLLQLSDYNPSNDVSSNSNDHLRFKFVSFKDDRLFRRQNHKEMLNRPVISASIGQKTVKNLQTPVTFKIPIGTIDPYLEIPVCVYWDPAAHEWSREGIVTKHNEKGETICESNHLTSFSVLLDPIGTPIMEEMRPVLSIITYIGITLSTVALIGTIVTFALFSFNRDRSGLIVMNLSIALLLMNLSFLASHFITSDQRGCWAFGALLHYAVTASFAWMLIEAVNMYQLLVTVFPSAETHFMRKRVVVGWVSPLVLVTVALAWNKNVYFTEHQSICVISPISAPSVYYTTYLAPVCIVLLINITVFFLVARVLCQSRPTYTRKVPVTLAQIRGAIAIVALLGITWLTGVFAVGYLRIASQVLFCFTTPFQGLIIFWVRVMQSADARMAWKTFLKTGSTRKRPQPLSSLRTHSSSHHASSFHTQSTGTTPPKSVYETALKTVRRLSSSGLGLIGSAKKFRNSTSSDGSTKRLNKKMSIDNEKNKKILANDSHPPGDNLICQFSHEPNNENNFPIMTNGDMKSQESYQNKINKEYIISEKSSPDVCEEEPMKDVHLILDIKLDNMKPHKAVTNSEQGSENYQEYIFSYLKSCREDNKVLQCDNSKKFSYSTSNLSPIKSHNKEECARSLESLLPTIGNGYLKTNASSYGLPANDDSKWKSTSESSSNRTSLRQKLNKTDSDGNGSYNDSVTKSASDSDINELTVSSTSELKITPKINLGLEESESEDPTMQEITLSSDPTMALSLSHRTSSELLLGPRTSDSYSFKRRSASISDLDFMGQHVPYQKFSSNAYL